jgi:hypothetical protein
LGRNSDIGHIGRSSRPSLAAEANHDLALLIFDLEIHDAGGRMIGKAKDEAAIRLRLCLKSLVERDR